MTAALTRLPGVLGADLRVPLVTGARIEYANLDLAASAPALESVAEHVAEVLPFSSSVHRGAGYASQVCTSLLETARTTIGRFLGARDDDVVVLTRSTTDALNLLATAVPGPVLCLDVEHHANLLPWADCRRVTAAPTIAQTLADLGAALAGGGFALVTITGASNVTGEALPIADIVALAHAAGARVALDAAQLAPHRRVDIAAWGVDYVAISGHKLYAPYGAGALVGRRDWLDAAPPFLAGGGATAAVRGDDVTWAAAPQRHEAGSPNVVGAAALAQACRTLTPVLDGRRARARAGAVGATRRGSRVRARRDTAADLVRQHRPRRRARLHRRRPARRLRRRLPLGRARHRRARRQVLRPPAARPAQPRLRRGPARQHRARHHRRAHRPAGRRPPTRW